MTPKHTKPGKFKVRLTVTNIEGEETLWSGDYQYAPHIKREETLHVFYSEDDSFPLFLLDQNSDPVRELSSKEAKEITEKGEVKSISHRFPRADKYGYPMSASQFPEVWAAICGNLGFFPSPSLELVTEDSLDDSAGGFVLEVDVPSRVAKSAHSLTKKAQRSFAEALGCEPGEETDAMLAYSTTRYSDENPADLDKKLKSLEKEFEAAGQRGIELADEIDELRGYLAAKKTIDG